MIFFIKFINRLLRNKKHLQKKFYDRGYLDGKEDGFVYGHNLGLFDKDEVLKKTKELIFNVEHDISKNCSYELSVVGLKKYTFEIVIDPSMHYLRIYRPSVPEAKVLNRLEEAN